MNSRKTNPEFMTGVPELLILRLLGHREMYGYELVQEIESATKSAISLGEGVVYPVLHALEARGHLKASKKLIGGRTRIYYAVTSAGTRRLRAMADDWCRISSAISSVIGAPYHVATNI